MRYGTVIQYFSAKGFGFIRPDVGPDVFFHVTALGACEPQPRIEPGQPVKFELELRPGPDPSPGGRRNRGGEEPAKPEPPARPQAKLVELIDRIPGATLEESTDNGPSTRHPRARQKKPTWRR